MGTKKIKFNATQIISLGFIVLILLGSFLLSTPLASRSGEWTPYTDALFTSTSATCVTGLIAFDTFSYWNIFGQLVILSLIQIGGIGFMTIVTMFAIALKKNIGLHERKLLMASAGSMKIAGVVALIKRICIGTFIFEALGAILLATRFIPNMGVLRGIYNSVFHSVSAFCNAGFDLMGKYEKFSSLTTYKSDVVVNVTIMMLIVIGGIGFIVWTDLFKNKFRFKKFQLHTKLVLVTSGSLIVLGAILFFILEYNNGFKGLSLGDKILASFFQSITPRTAGFNTIDLTQLSTSGTVLTDVLMYIGGSPGSTAGGIKTTTFLVLILEVVSLARGQERVIIFKKRLDETILRQASTVATIYLMAIIIATMIISAVQSYSLSDILFEVFSAVATVGLSKGISPHHNEITQIVLVILMYLGRIGGLTFALLIGRKIKKVPVERPVEKLIVG